MLARVSVVLPVLNAGPYFAPALASIVRQTLPEVEVIVVDDGSTDGSREHAERVGQMDRRVRVAANAFEKGIVGALNTGLDLARGDYIARMDGDDISLQNRLAAQVAFLDSHPEIGVCGAWARTIGFVEGQVWKYPTDHEAIRATMLFNTPLAHPLAMFRRQLFADLGLRYDRSFEFAEDLELWERAARKVRLANLPRILLYYRTHRGSTTAIRRQDQVRNTERVLRRGLEQLRLEPTTQEWDVHRRLALWDNPTGEDFRDRAQRWVERIAAANAATGTFCPDALAGFINGKFSSLGIGLAAGEPLPRPPAALPPPQRTTVYMRLKRITPLPVKLRLKRSLEANRPLVATAARIARMGAWRLAPGGPLVAEGYRVIKRVTPVSLKSRLKPFLAVAKRWVPLSVKVRVKRAVQNFAPPAVALQSGLLVSPVAPASFPSMPPHIVERIHAGSLRVGFAVLCYERSEYLETCLESLFSAKPHGDIIYFLIDDGSQDPRVRALIERPRAPHHRIVRRFEAKGPNNAGAAINRALRIMREYGEFDLLGWSDPDALYHPDWIEKTLGTCLWAKLNHREHKLGPFTSFNSSDELFHKVLGRYTSPEGPYVVKRQAGMLNYFLFAHEADALGPFAEAPEDETEMTAQLEQMGVQNFSTGISYVEHIGQDSVLNRWRPTPVRRAVYGLDLAPQGWPDAIATAGTVGYYRDVKGSQTVGEDVASPVPLDIVCVTRDAESEILPLSIASVHANLRHPVGTFWLIAPADSKLREMAARLGCRYVCEDELLPLRRKDIDYQFLDADRSGWLFQQLLKFSADQLVSNDRYLVLDGDTVLLKPQVFQHQGKDVLLHSEQFHAPYFDALMALLEIEPKTLLSCVAHHMLFDRGKLAALKAHVEARSGTDWVTAIRNATDLSDRSGFSEYETYGQWCLSAYPEQIHREFWYNIQAARKPGMTLKELMATYGQRHRSISFHWYLPADYAAGT